MGDGPFTAEECNWITQKELGPLCKTKDTLVAHYLKQNYLQLESLNFLADYLRTKPQYKNLISFGSGLCVTEFLLNTYLDKKFHVHATDFNEFFIKNAQTFFPEISASVFDFNKGSLSDFAKQAQVSFDIGIGFGSFYVMGRFPFFSRLIKAIH